MPPDGVNTKLITTNELLTTLGSLTDAIETNTEAQITQFTAYASAFDDLSSAINAWYAIFGQLEISALFTRLQQISECVCLLSGGVEPQEDSPNGCNTFIPSLNDRNVTAEEYPGRNFVEWDAVLPQGAELANDVYPELSTGIEVHLTGDGTYYLWMQSSCHTFKTTPESLVEYPTNRWVAVDGPNTIAVNLASGCTGTCFLCVDPALGFVDCVTRESTITENVHASNDDSTRVRLSVPLDGLGLDLVDTIVISGTTFTSDSGLTWTTSDMNDVVISWVSGVNIRVFYRTTGVGIHVEQMDSGNPTHTVTGPTDWFGIDNWVNPVGDTGSPFVVEICPNAPA